MSVVIHLVSLALIILGIVGAVIQVIPSGVLVGLAVLIWAIYLGTTGRGLYLPSPSSFF